MPHSGMSSPPLKSTVTIEVSFGSEIQRDVSMKVLRQLLEAWKTNLIAAHQRNKVMIPEREEH
jgi:hypothetical protein